MASPPFPPTASRRRVVITGAGLITGLGCGWGANADGFRTGRTSFREVTLFDTARQRVSRAAEAALPDRLPRSSLTRRQLARVDRATALVLHAASEAFAAGGWDRLSAGDREGIPIVLGTSAGAMALGECYFRQAIAVPVSNRGQAMRVQHYQVQSQARLLGDALALPGPVSIISNACASGANAIGHAFHLIRGGRAERVLCGGYDALCHLVFAGFDSLQALSPDVPRPFDARRDGLGLGEGAGVCTVESLESAESRGAAVLGEIIGYGAATDRHHLTQPHPDGEAAMRSMQQACAVAGVRPADIDYLNSHGTGTILNDAAEARAIRRWCEAAGDPPARLPVSSTKGAIGHLLGGAGAVEAIVCLMAITEGFLPPNAGLREPDPAVAFDLVARPRRAGITHALSNSFGFGGANATLILKRWP